MPRHRPVLAPFALAGILTACQGTPALPELTDPIEIVEAAALTTAAASTVHIEIAADGELALPMLGGGAPVELTDSTASIDLDLAAGDAKLTFALPGVLGIRGELIAVDGTAYAKTSLTGPLYQRMALADAGVPDGGTGGSPDPSALAELAASLRDALEQPGVDPVKGSDATCGNATCYQVTMQLTPDELAALAGGVAGGELPLPSDLPVDVPLPSLGDQTVDVTVLVEKDTRRLAGLVAGVAGSDVDLELQIGFSAWDADLTIAPPPADEIAPGG